uniref:Uncharacterized protein n=1 Tax=Oryza punctata TaxID=4537 RepID=A0A0E0KKU9_ORYPU
MEGWLGAPICRRGLANLPLTTQLNWPDWLSLYSLTPSPSPLPPSPVLHTLFTSMLASPSQSPTRQKKGIGVGNQLEWEWAKLDLELVTEVMGGVSRRRVSPTSSLPVGSAVVDQCHNGPRWILHDDRCEVIALNCKSTYQVATGVAIRPSPAQHKTTDREAASEPSRSPSRATYRTNVAMRARDRRPHHPTRRDGRNATGVLPQLAGDAHSIRCNASSRGLEDAKPNRRASEIPIERKKRRTAEHMHAVRLEGHVYWWVDYWPYPRSHSRLSPR